jgi:hypothetical protein
VGEAKARAKAQAEGWRRAGLKAEQVRRTQGGQVDKTTFEVRTAVCPKCKWVSQEKAGQMACRYNPPQFVVITAPNGVQIQCAWPNVGATDYCGKWEAQLDG